MGFDRQGITTLRFDPEAIKPFPPVVDRRPIWIDLIDATIDTALKVLFVIACGRIMWWW